MKHYTYPAVLTIAGSDPSGGAGIQADLKTFSALGCYGMSVITALTAQNTLGVTGIHSIPPHFVAEQLETLLQDITPLAIKIGMVHTPQLAGVIADCLLQFPNIPVVLDPVMIATSGDRLIENETVAAIIQKLFPLATVITPNMDEAALLAGTPVTSVADMQAAGKTILGLDTNAVLVKGGHLPSEQLTSLLFTSQSHRVTEYTSQKIATKNMHGSGCTLSSAIAACLALGDALPQAVQKAQDYVHGAILHGADVITGKGHGPLNHFYNPQTLKKHELE
ncbi:bifunctional hydroxymethylpyrimidine kinase/phosphomethylpyrimidine kinase [Flavobacterium zepuense]|uniref:hydroxymethylpyrimidine kinase n=1 Tax=Flavobacterium zepuense TaxID=2593302 RepID=A0A552V3W1_9FLAO|nr:bifunctional hydroxymethylpyrimidine kinase/phosphomethylpyrimidine kinase [Flavobacterium zepuense]TRW25152.1 bifunctional hydroxymethylpyrimidine kinase/phosphomethylpyrimidine kinase [Flavobacterium zepuense]